MKLLEERIIKDGIVLDEKVLKVDSFLNHQIDVTLFFEMGKEFKRLFANEGINKILTIESSGIGIACITAQFFNVPVVFAKKNKTKNVVGEVYMSEVESFTHGRVYKVVVSKNYLGKNDSVLIIDDFLANGNAAFGLVDIVSQAGGSIAGIGIAIEKGFQTGGEMLRSKGLHVESLAIIDGMSPETGIVFR